MKNHTSTLFAVALVALASTAGTEAAENTKANESISAKTNNMVVKKAPSTEDKKTSAAVSQIPGVKVAPSELTPPEAVPIKGFHPIKRMLQPVVNLEGMSIKLEQQIMKLEGPIAALHPPMVDLESKMLTVDGTMQKMQNQVDGVNGQMKGIREDLAKMSEDIGELKQPMYAVQKPLVGLSHPLERVQQQLNLVMIAIVLATLGVVIGTPFAAVLVYRNKDKLFPPRKDVGTTETRQPVASSR